MALLIYKQRHGPVLSQKTPGLNVAHIKYIATRPGSLKNEGMNHGLFGNLLNHNRVNSLPSYSDVQKMVYDVSQKSRHVYRSIISFDPVNAKKLGLDQRKDWEIMIRKEMSVISEKNRIKIEDLRWCAAVHHELNHPHCHIIFWDGGKDKVKGNFVSPKIADEIRIQLIKDIFQNEFQELCENKNRSYAAFQENFRGLVAEFEGEVEAMSLKEVKALWGDDFGVPLKYQCTMSKNTLIQLSEELWQINGSLPQQGSLKYMLLPQHIKLKIDDFVEHLLREDIALKKAKNNYVLARMELLECYRMPQPDDVDGCEIVLDYWHKYNTEADINIANCILQSFKTVNATVRGKEFSAIAASKEIFASIYYLLGALKTEENLEDYYQFGKAMERAKSYSKQAKKEYFKQNQHGHGW